MVSKLHVWRGRQGQVQERHAEKLTLSWGRWVPWTVWKGGPGFELCSRKAGPKLNVMRAQLASESPASREIPQGQGHTSLSFASQAPTRVWPTEGTQLNRIKINKLPYPELLHFKPYLQLWDSLHHSFIKPPEGYTHKWGGKIWKQIITIQWNKG